MCANFGVIFGLPHEAQDCGACFVLGRCGCCGQFEEAIRQGKAIAEIPNVPTAAAIANAIQDAVGVRLYDLPLTSEKIYAALNGVARG